MSRVLLIASSLRGRSNSDRIAEEIKRGAESAGHETELISLKGKTIHFCTGCLACQKTGRCVIPDDAVPIAENVRRAETVVFVTPIYYYSVSGQLKTMMDRLNPLFPGDYDFRHVYMAAVAAEDEPFAPKRAEETVRGWTDCFEKAAFEETFFAGGLGAPGEAAKDEDALARAYEFGKSLK